MGHGKVICKKCNKLISQCRCPCKDVEYIICDECKKI